MVIGTILIDRLSKIRVENALASYQPYPIAGQFFRLSLGYNDGVAFGLFSNGGIWPLFISGIVIILMFIWFLLALHKGDLPLKMIMPIGLIYGGAIANFTDRLNDGRVTDFLDIGIGSLRWPTFNLADSLLVIGIAILMLLTIKKETLTNEQ